MARSSILLVPALFTALAAACATSVDDHSFGRGGSDPGSGGQGGSSSSSSSSSSGAPGPCTSAADCASFTDTCNVGTCINGACAKVPTNENAPCDDGKTCTENDSCKAGVCTGPLKFCPSMDTCHVGSCDVATDTCVQVPGNDGTPCVDNDPCTTTGACQAGQCTGGGQVDCSFLDGACSVGVCDSQLGCVTMPKNDGAACNDNFYCTVNDTCQQGVCKGQPNNCAAPGEPCQVGVCNEAAKSCQPAQAPDGTACDNGTGCASGSTCLGGVCQGGVPANEGVTCNDNNACTTNTVCTAGSCAGGSSIVACAPGDGCCPAGCTGATDTDCNCFNDFLVGTPCNGVNFGNGCSPSDTGYHFVGIYDGYACFWHQKNQAWNTSTSSNFYALAQHFMVTPGVGRCHWCDNKFAQPTPLAYDSCTSYFDQNNVGAWGWCAEVDPDSVGFVCIPTDGVSACP